MRPGPETSRRVARAIQAPSMRALSRERTRELRDAVDEAERWEDLPEWLREALIAAERELAALR